MRVQVHGTRFRGKSRVTRRAVRNQARAMVRRQKTGQVNDQELMGCLKAVTGKATDNLTLSKCRAGVYIGSSTGENNQLLEGAGLAMPEQRSSMKHGRNKEIMTCMFVIVPEKTERE